MAAHLPDRTGGIGAGVRPFKSKMAAKTQYHM